MTRIWWEIRRAFDDWKRIRRIRQYQLQRDALSDNLPTTRTMW